MDRAGAVDRRAVDHRQTQHGGRGCARPQVNLLRQNLLVAVEAILFVLGAIAVGKQLLSKRGFLVEQSVLELG